MDLDAFKANTIQRIAVLRPGTSSIRHQSPTFKYDPADERGMGFGLKIPSNPRVIKGLSNFNRILPYLSAFELTNRFSFCNPHSEAIVMYYRLIAATGLGVRQAHIYGFLGASGRRLPFRTYTQTAAVLRGAPWKTSHKLKKISNWLRQYLISGARRYTANSSSPSVYKSRVP